MAILPFTILLFGIAALPLATPKFWEHNRNKAIFVGALSTPVAGWLLQANPARLGHSLVEYASFLCLLGSLFVVAGGVHVSGNLLATPGINTFLLGTAAVLANVIGTTGASMLLIRLVLRTNAERRTAAAY